MVICLMRNMPGARAIYKTRDTFKISKEGSVSCSWDTIVNTELNSTYVKEFAIIG